MRYTPPRTMKPSVTFLFLIVGATPPQEAANPGAFTEEKIRQLIEQLADDNVGQREEATAALKRAGEKARKGLEEASRSSNQERAGRADRLLWALDQIRVVIQIKDLEGAGGSDPIPAVVRVRNLFEEPRLYYEQGFDVTVWLMELHEEPPQEGRRGHGGTFFGRSSNGCALSASDFLKLAPGSEHTIRIDDLRKHWGFQIAEKILEKYPEISLEAPTRAGKYKVVATYTYDGAKYIAECKKGCPGHPDPAAPWNRCFGKPLRAEAEFILK
jgi:hypothetical protein